MNTSLSKNKEQNKAKNQTIQIPQFVALESTVGAIVFLMMKSQSHKYLFTSDLESLIFPPIIHKQFALFRNNKNEPLAFVSWAKVNDEVEKRLMNGSMKLKPEDWNSGNKIYIMDVVTPLYIADVATPLPSAKEFLKQLQKDKFKDEKVYILKPKTDDKGNVNGFLKLLLEEVLKEEKGKN